MDFFNCSKLVSPAKALSTTWDECSIINLDSTKICNDAQAYKLASLCDQLYASGTLFSLHNLDFATRYTVNELSYKNPVYVGLVGNYSNHLAGTSDTNEDLTMFGRFAVRSLTLRQVMIDLRNLSEKSFMSVLKESSFPSIITDAGLSGLYGKDVLKPYQEKMLVDTGGIIAINPTKNGLPISDTAISIADFIERFGSKNLALSCLESKDKAIIKTLEMLKIYLFSYGVTQEDIENIYYKNK